LSALIEVYLVGLGTELMPDTPPFRNQSGTAFSKDALCRAPFARTYVSCSPATRAKLMDFRRSGAVEAQAGNVDPTALAAKMANSINQSKRLQDTYLPKRATTVRLADEARRRGRQALRENES
jgi:ubiquitin